MIACESRLQVVQRIDDIRLMLLRDPAKKLQMEQAIKRYCLVSDAPEDELSVEEVRRSTEHVRMNSRQWRYDVVRRNCHLQLCV